MSAPRKVRCTWLYYKVGNDAVKGQAMNWMLSCTARLQTKDKPHIYLCLLLSWKIENGGCSKVLGGRTGQFNQERSQCIKDTDRTLIHLILKAMNKTSGIIFESTYYEDCKKSSTLYP